MDREGEPPPKVHTEFLSSHKVASPPNQKIIWGEEEEAKFQDINNVLISPPVLALPQDTRKWKVETDASNLATGGVLLQKQTDGTWRPVDYISKGLSLAEKNYDIYDKEFLAVIWALSGSLT